MIKAKEVGEKTTYHTVTDMATQGHYALANGNLMQASSDAATLSPFRWYLDITDRNGNPSSAKARKIFLSFDDGETTEISVVEANDETSSIYSIGGVNMGKDNSALPKGLYIRNGKKFLVK